MEVHLPDTSTKLDMTALRLSPAFSMEAKATAEGVLEGLASPFGGDPDAYGDIIQPGAYSRSLDRHKREKSAPVMLWAHDQSRPVGRWEVLQERADGLHVRGRLNLGTSAGREAFEHLRSGDLNGLSIGFTVADGGAKRGAGGVRELTDIELHEISLVAIPAARSARVSSVKALELKSRAELRDLLREAGLPKAAADKISRGGYPALSGDDIDIDAVADELKEIARLF